MRKLPGIDIPIATEANIRHAAAYLEFKHHVERLVRERHDTAAYTCWMHAVGIAMLLRFWRSSGEAGQGEA